MNRADTTTGLAWAADPMNAPSAFACHAVIAESYARADAGARSSIADLFLYDGRHAIGSDSVHGREAIRDVLAVRDRAGRRTVHVVSNLRFDAVGPEVIGVDYVLTLYLLSGPDPRVPDSLCLAHDVLVKTTDGWRFQSRELAIAAGA